MLLMARLRRALTDQVFLNGFNFTEATLVKVRRSTHVHIAYLSPAALPRNLFRHRPQGFARHHGQVLHPSLGENRESEERDRHGPHRGALEHED
jgi:hypothetical protein